MTGRYVVPLALSAGSTTRLRPYRGGAPGLPGVPVAVVGYQPQTYDNPATIRFATAPGASLGAAHVVGYQHVALRIPITDAGLVVTVPVKTTIYLEYEP